MQSRELFEKQKLSGHNSRTVVVDKKQFVLRGYEDIVVRYLHEEMDIPVKQIRARKSEGLPSIQWTDKLGKERFYHPDLYVKIRGRWWIVEVKSDYTAGLTHSRSSLYGQLRQKARATAQAGYRFLLVVVCKPDRDDMHPIHFFYNADRLSKKEVLAQMRS